VLPAHSGGPREKRAGKNILLFVWGLWWFVGGVGRIAAIGIVEAVLQQTEVRRAGDRDDKKRRENVPGGQRVQARS